MKLNLISFFLCLLMAVQMLPIQQIGKILASNQWAEELPHDMDDTGNGASVKFSPPFLPPGNYSTFASFASQTNALADIHLSDQIPSNHSTEVVSPPPDSVC